MVAGKSTFDSVCEKSLVFVDIFLLIYLDSQDKIKNQMNTSKVTFRFQKLEIWKLAKEIALILMEIADKLEQMKLFRFAEQIRASGLSMPNNIAEGSGSDSSKEFNLFLNYSRRSIFESANMLLVFGEKGYFTLQEIDPILLKLDILSRKISSFKRTLK